MREGKSSSVNNKLAVDRLAHNPKVGGSNPPPATNLIKNLRVPAICAFPLVPLLSVF